MGWQLDESALDVLVELERHEREMRQGRVFGGMADLCTVVFGYAALKIRGYDSSPKPLLPLLNECVDASVELHFGDWWKEENIVSWCRELGFSEKKTEAEVAYAKKFAFDSVERVPMSRESLGLSILACQFTNRNDDLRRICRYYDPRTRLDYCGEMIDELYQRCLLLIAANLCGENVEQHESLIKAMKRRPLKISTVLENLARAVFEDRPDDFAELLPASIGARTRKWEFSSVIDLIAIEESILVNLAIQKGWAVPKVSKTRREFLLLCENLVD